MTIEQLLRNLFHGYTMNRMEQVEASNLIKKLQESNQSLSEGMIKCAEELAALRRDLSEATRGQK